MRGRARQRKKAALRAAWWWFTWVEIGENALPRRCNRLHVHAAAHLWVPNARDPAAFLDLPRQGTSIGQGPRYALPSSRRRRNGRAEWRPGLGMPVRRAGRVAREKRAAGPAPYCPARPRL